MSQKRRLIYQLNMARHAMIKAMSAQCQSEIGVSFVQLSALMVLTEQDNCLMKDMANILKLDKSAVTGLVKRMEDKSLIQRTPCERDSRASRLSITAKGKQVLKKGKRLLQQGNKIMNDGFSEDELDTVSRYLQHLTNLFSEGHT